jgi:hypothetical protein
MIRTCKHCGRQFAQTGPGRPAFYCQVCAKSLGTNNGRGYGAEHRKLRAQWKVRVEAGEVCCARCGYQILPGTPWHLDHDDQDRTRYLGPSHKACNMKAAGYAGYVAAFGPKKPAKDEPPPPPICRFCPPEKNCQEPHSRLW